MTESEFPTLGKSQKADICLLLEGTYPYVRGGVSSWVHQLMVGLPHYQFALIFVGASSEHYSEMHFEFPPNVCHFERHFLNDSLELGEPKEHKLDAETTHVLKSLYELLSKGGQAPSLKELAGLHKFLTRAPHYTDDQFFYSPEIWDMITHAYRNNCPELPFNEFFWNVRAMHAPILALLKISLQAPMADCYHTISTGYAGLLGLFLRLLKNKPLMVTEHGIYTKERQIDLYQVDWIKENNPHLAAGLDDQISFIRQLWMQFFEGLGRLTYSGCIVIVTLYGQNRQKQIDLGAPPERSIVIPNGVKIERFIPLRDERSETIPPVLCLLGRVVPIKDIKTYIRAIGMLREKIPDVEGWIVGPEEEEPEYAAECHALVEQLGLQDNMKFLGFQNINDILPKMSLMTLSSISEGQPLVILEGYAAGVPVLSTDVGSCRELVEGRTDEDRALGSAGSIVPIANPRALAEAAAELLADEERWYQAQKSAIARVELLYGEQTFLDNYQDLYQKVLKHGRNRV